MPAHNYPGSPQFSVPDLMKTPTNKHKDHRLHSETWSSYSGLPLLQASKEPLVIPIMRWVFIVLALTLLGFVLFVFGHLIHDHVLHIQKQEERGLRNQTKM